MLSWAGCWSLPGACCASEPSGSGEGLEGGGPGMAIVIEKTGGRGCCCGGCCRLSMADGEYGYELNIKKGEKRNGDRNRLSHI